MSQKYWLLFCTVLVLVGCAQTSPGVASHALELNITHINDHHSNLEALRDYPLTINGVPTTVDIGGFARVASVISGYEVTQKNLLKIHAGDAQTGTLFNPLFEGEADSAVMNRVCFDSFTLGNHEFDAGDAGLRKFLDFLKSDAKCHIPVLSANVHPALGTPLKPATGVDYFKPYLVRQMEGVPVGIVGITVRQKTVISSRPLPSTEFQEEVDAARMAIAELKAQGVRNIIVASHFGFDNERLLASKLPEVDVVIGGDSHTLLGEELRTYGFPVGGSYPTRVKNADGDTVCIGQAWEYTKAVGLMHVRFSKDGKVESCSGQVVVPIGDNFQQNKQPVDEETRKVLLHQFGPAGSLRVVEPDPAVAQIVADFRSKLDGRLGRKIGVSQAGLCHVRVPGGGLNTGCGSHGSDAAQVVAQAFFDASRRADIALQNAGGVRVSVPEGDLTYDTAFRVLPFSNTLVELQLSGEEILAALEDGVANWRDPQVNGFRGSDGSHPYAAHLRWDLNLNQPRGSRFSNVEVKDKSTGRWLPLEPHKTYVVVTNGYIASGRDGYTTLGSVFSNPARGTVDTGLYYTQTFVDYILRNKDIDKLPLAEYSHQKVTNNGSVQTR